MRLPRRSPASPAPRPATSCNCAARGRCHATDLLRVACLTGGWSSRLSTGPASEGSGAEVADARTSDRGRHRDGAGPPAPWCVRRRTAPRCGRRGRWRRRRRRRSHRCRAGTTLARGELRGREPYRLRGSLLRGSRAGVRTWGSPFRASGQYGSTRPDGVRVSTGGLAGRAGLDLILICFMAVSFASRCGLLLPGCARGARSTCAEVPT